MPAAVVAVVATWAGGAAATAMGFVAGTFAYAAVSMAVSFAVTAIGNKLIGGSRGGVSPQERRETIRHPSAARRVIYGEVRAGGVLVFAGSSGSGNAYANLVIAVGEGEIEGFDSVFWINDKLSTESQFSGLVDAHFFTGTADQAASTDLITECPASWTEDHRLQAIAYAYLRLQYNATAFPTGLPALSFLIKGRKIYDPRSDTIAYSNNPALCTLDYIRSGSDDWAAQHPGIPKYGLAVPDDLIDWDSFESSANECDELVTSLDEDYVEDETPYRVKRYTLNGVIDLSASPAAIVEDMLSSCGGSLVFTQGKYRFFAAAYREPHELVLTSEFLRGDPKVRMRPARSDLFNTVRGKYIEPRQDWHETDYPEQVDTAAIADDGSEIVQDVRFPFTTNGAIAQRLARLSLNKARDSSTLTLPCNWAALSWRLWDVVEVDLPELDIAGTYLITEYSFPEGGGINLVLQSHNATDYDWSTDDEQIIESVIKPEFNTDTPPTPTGLTVSGNPLEQAFGYIPTIEATWDQDDSPMFSHYQAQIKQSISGPSSWMDVPVAGNTFTKSFLLLTEYDVRVRAVYVDGRQSDWAQVDETLLSGDVTPPDVPTDLSVSGSGTLTIEWTTPNNVDFKRCNVYRNSSMTPTGATFIRTVYGFQLSIYNIQHTPGSTTYYYVSSLDSTGNESALTYAGTGS